MKETSCEECRRLMEAAVLIHLDPQGFQGVFIKCDKEQAYCIYCRSQFYLSGMGNRNKERVIREYQKKSR